MPYINDKIAENQEFILRRKFMAKASRTSRFAFDPKKVIEELRKNIVGQEDVIGTMTDILYLLKADFSDINRPLSVNFFLGPTGVGKTETVKLISKSILGDDKNFCRIDMNTLAQEHYAAALTGAPPGYVGSKEGYTLFNVEAIEGSFSRPGIVLFDEIEKASNEVVRSILNILDTGKLKIAGGTKEINFSNSLIFMTSNVGAREYSQAAHKRKWWPFGGGSGQEEISERALKERFDPEFLNRIERIVHFKSLGHAFVDSIIDIELHKINQRLMSKNAQVTIDNSARAEIGGYYNIEYGARNLAHLMHTKLGPVVAKSMMENVEQENFVVSFVDGKFCVLTNI